MPLRTSLNRLCRHTRRALLAGTSLAALTATMPVPAEAGGLRDSVVNQAAGAAAASTAASQAAAAASAQALIRVNDSLRAMRDVQAAARAAASAAAGGVRNGLAPGGLVVAPGAVPSATDFGSGLWQGADLPTSSTGATGRTQVEIKQTTSKAILTWSSFNVGRETDLYFNQTAGGSNASQWIALNRVIDPSLAPSRILGTIRADGQVYVINKNGIIFGGSSQINANTFVASSLNLKNDQFQAGIDAPLYVFLDGNGNWTTARPQFGDYADVMPLLVEVGDPRQVAPYVPDRVPGDVVVQAGATINVASGGKALLFAPHVANRGQISAPDGQVILAAGEQVWLATSPVLTGTTLTPNVLVRGLDVAVSAPSPYAFYYDQLTSGLMSAGTPLSNFNKSMRDVILPQMAARAATVGYSVVNDGVVLADRGNITLAGRDITQNGWLGVTTALNNRDGTVRLLAWDQGLMAYASGMAELFYWSAGKVTLGGGSVVSVLPDAGDTSEIELTALANRYTAGQVAIRGKTIDIESQASIIAPAGKISLVASTWPQAGEKPVPGETGLRDGSEVYIAENAYLSVAGLKDIALAMESNVVKAELRINELRDSPLYRESWLHGLTVLVDRRVSGTFADGPMAGVSWGDVAGKWTGTPLADVSAWIGTGKTTLAELSTVGGSILVKSSGALITRAGSSLDVSGGSVRYADGWITTTKLLGADGRIYDIGEATPDRVYVGLVGDSTISHSRWSVTDTYVNRLSRANSRRFEAGYTEGRNAGAIQLYGAEGIVLEGDFFGGVIAGRRQSAGIGTPATAGTFTVGGSAAEETQWQIGNLIISSHPTMLPAGFDSRSVLGATWFGGSATDVNSYQKKTTYLDSDILAASGMGAFKFYVTKSLGLAAGETLELTPKTAFSVSGAGPGVGDFTIGGTIRIAGGTVSLGAANSIVLESGSVIDVGGEWVNELIDGAGARAPAIDGGKITLAAYLSGTGTPVLDVSGGGRLSSSGGKTRLKAGNAGSIDIYARTAAQIARLDMRAYAAGSGGALNIRTTAAVQLGGAAPADPATLYLPGTVFSDRGFRSLSVALPDLTVAPLTILVPDGAVVDQAPLNIDLVGIDLSRVASGAKITDLGPLRALRDIDRAARLPASLSLSGSVVTVGTGAVVRTDIGGSIGLAVSGDAIVRGTLIAPAGSIGVTAGGNVTLAATARLLARGVPLIAADARGYLGGSVLQGGSIAIAAGNPANYSTGTITLTAGSLLDVSGAAADIDRPPVRGVLPGEQRIRLVSNGGSIALTDTGVGTSTIDATLLGYAGGPGAAGGTLSITETSPATVVSTSPLLMSPTLPTTVWYKDPATGVAKSILVNCTTCDLDIYDEYSGTVATSTSMRTALNQLRTQLQYGVLVVDGRAADAGGATASVKAWEYNTAISQPFVELLSKYFYTSSALTTKITIPDMQATTAVGVTRVAASSLSNGGFGNVSITTPSGIRLGSNVVVGVPGTLTLNLSGNMSRLSSVVAGSNATLRANDIVFNSAGNLAAYSSAYSSATTGKLTLAAPLIEVLGANNIRGYGETSLETGELRIDAISAASASAAQKVGGRLDAEGKLTIKAADVYPVSGVAATIKSNGSITVLQNGAATLPYSVAGSLTVSAPVIEQDGTLLAPFGTITLSATTSLTLGAGSLTSVSGNGLILPYGNLSNGDSWTQTPLGSTTVNVLASLPDKKVTLSAPTVNQRSGAVVDISGGGDLYASEFVAGPGGSHDVLAMAGVYAIIPSYSSAIAPRNTTASLAVGDRIWLAGGDGLAAGWYTLLPAQYALLPGAYTVQMVTGSTGKALTRSVTLNDGAMVVAGYRANVVSGAAQPLASSWRVMSGSTLRRYSEYNEALADDFFASDAFKLGQYRLTGVNVVTPRLPMDGGAVVLQATQTLILDGQLRSQAVAGGIGGLVDIAGTKIAVVNGDHRNDADLAGYLVVDSAALSNYHAASLLIGGTRAVDPAGTRITVMAGSIIVRNDGGAPLSGPEIMLAATGSIAVDAGSAVVAQGDIAARAGDLVIAPVSASSDYGALIRVSNGGAINVIRQNVVTSTGGLVTIGAGARLAGGKALLIDATRNTALSSSAQVSGDALTLSSGRIGLGGGGGGLVLSAQNLAQLSSTRTLTLRSYSTIDLFASLNFGDSGVGDVVLDAAGLVGYGSNSVAIAADKITLKNSSATLVEPTGTGSGTLAFHAGELVLGVGNKAIRGFNAVMLSGTRRIVGEGNGALDAAAAAVALVAPVVTGRGGAYQSVTTLGALSVSGGGLGDLTDSGQSLGARLAFTGGHVTVDGRILAPGGAVDLTATSGDVVVEDGAIVDVGGFGKRFYDVVAYADAGRVSLTAIGGSVRVAAGATIDLQADDNGGNAGTLAVTATGGGTVALDGSLRAQAGRGVGGSFSLDIDALPDFAGLNRRLNEAGFYASRQFRIRSGDVSIDGVTTVANFGLVADRGSVTINGLVDAKSAYGGSISISAGNGITMNAGARLNANATAELGGGRVLLDAVGGTLAGVAGGTLDLAGGTIDVGGGQGGVVRLRALQTNGLAGASRHTGGAGDHVDVAVDRLDATITGARVVNGGSAAVLEAVGVYTDTSVDTAMATAATDAATFMAARPGRLAGKGFGIMAGIEIRSSGDLTLASDLDLNSRFDASLRQGGLTLRAAGNLAILGNLSDGFSTALSSGTLSSGASWDLRLVAGADLTSAGMLATVPSAGLPAASGSVTIGSAAAGKLVRTGTGDLAVRAGRDVSLANYKSVVYTAGQKDADVANFAKPAAASYGVNGGNLSIAAQGSVAAPTEPVGSLNGQIIADWLQHQGTTGAGGIFTVQSSWWVDYTAFSNGVGALGGGNVSLVAGGDLANLVVALATNGRVSGGTAAVPAKSLAIRNGGALDVDVGGAIRGGQLYVGRGAGTIVAGEFATGRTAGVIVTTAPGSTTSYVLAPVLALGDATMSVTTAGDLRLQTVLDPLMAGTVSMSGYTERTALDLTSVGGNVILVDQGKYLSRFVSVSIFDHCCVTSEESYQWFTTSAANLYPSRTSITALNGNVQIPPMTGPSSNMMFNRLMTMPGREPELQILAEGNVLLNGPIVMSWATADMLPSPLLPTSGATQNSDLAIKLLANGTSLGIVDTEPSRIYARTGSIIAALPAASMSSEIRGAVTTSEQTWFRAGTDIRNDSFQLRNVNRTDVSLLEAGNDIIPGTITILGPGALELSAGRDVYSPSAQIQSLGNLYFNNRLNLYQVVAGLPAGGAGISVLAGMGGKQPAYDALIAAYLDPANVAAMPDYLKVDVGGITLPIYLVTSQETRKSGNIHVLREGVVGFVARITGQTLAPLDAFARFKSLPTLTQQRFLREVYIEELREADNDQNTLDAKGNPLNGGYNRGYAAIATLFPGAGWKGDAKFGNLMLQTKAGGDIDILAPGGIFQAAAVSAVVSDKYGVVTLGGGNIGIFADRDVAVNQSRILTFAGGDEVIWSTRGDIDAGRGAKTARSVSKPTVATDVDANTKVTESPDITGSGIGTVIGYNGVAEGDVHLIAPQGTVNAGDGGIRVSGDFTVAARFVLNIDNIQVGGQTKGVPKAPEAVAVLTVQTKDKAAADAVANATRQTSAAERPSVIIVEILGYGGASGEDGAPGDEGGRRKPPDKRSSYDPADPIQIVGFGPLSRSDLERLTDEEKRKLSR
ncbi:MAG: filamentous hemagglutinin family protein [Rhodoplanes sp.]|uniref:filamentous haemagglutinin family protein n=1 Tax=Rhodoplanes sp. TaxID=1968906 RepID=UPI0017A3B53F|nr:filamentous haemagglutinin family protein [Rhodoplanes sp.]NVO13596.1 filamentous hemagglutinin family protein [Rhodoplanes sp.]